MSGRTRLTVDGARLEGITRGPLPASRKGYLRGTLHPEVRVPVRHISLTPTRTRQGQGWVETPNAPLTVYDPSGPFTDPEASIDLRRGLVTVQAAYAKSGKTRTVPLNAPLRAALTRRYQAAPDGADRHAGIESPPASPG